MAGWLVDRLPVRPVAGFNWLTVVLCGSLSGQLLSDCYSGGVDFSLARTDAPFVDLIFISSAKSLCKCFFFELLWLHAQMEKHVDEQRKQTPEV